MRVISFLVRTTGTRRGFGANVFYFAEFFGQYNFIEKQNCRERLVLGCGGYVFFYGKMGKKLADFFFGKVIGIFGVVELEEFLNPFQIRFFCSIGVVQQANFVFHLR